MLTIWCNLLRCYLHEAYTTSDLVLWEGSSHCGTTRLKSWCKIQMLEVLCLYYLLWFFSMVLLIIPFRQMTGFSFSLSLYLYVCVCTCILVRCVGISLNDFTTWRALEVVGGVIFVCQTFDSPLSLTSLALCSVAYLFPFFFSFSLRPYPIPACFVFAVLPFYLDAFISCCRTLSTWGSYLTACISPALSLKWVRVWFVRYLSPRSPILCGIDHDHFTSWLRMVFSLFAYM